MPIMPQPPMTNMPPHLPSMETIAASSKVVIAGAIPSPPHGMHSTPSHGPTATAATPSIVIHHRTRPNSPAARVRTPGKFRERVSGDYPLRPRHHPLAKEEDLLCIIRTITRLGRMQSVSTWRPCHRAVLHTLPCWRAARVPMPDKFRANALRLFLILRPRLPLPPEDLPTFGIPITIHLGPGLDA